MKRLVCKRCATCKKIKGIAEYTKRTRSADGLNYECKMCVKKYHKKWQKENRDKVKKNQEDFYKRHGMTKSQYNKKYYNKSGYDKKYYEKNREKILKYKKELFEKNPHWHNSKRVLARLRKSGAAPKWLDKDMLMEIDSFYECAKALKTVRGIQYEVDHIIPLNSDYVCGLHVPWNLQILTKEENIEKGNSISN